MIKIRIAGLTNDIEFDDDNVNIIEIKNQKYFKSMINTLNTLINYQETDERFILIENEHIIPFEKNAMLIFDIFNMEFNDKKILNCLYNLVSEYIKIDSSIEDNYVEIISKLSQYLKTKLNDTTFEYTIKDDVKVEDLLKIFNVKIDSDYYLKLIEKICFLFDLVSVFSLTKVIILVNVKYYFEKEELEEIYKYAKAKKINLLIIEANCTDEILKYEKKLYIDEEYDDFLIE